MEIWKTIDLIFEYESTSALLMNSIENSFSWYYLQHMKNYLVSLTNF